nr:MAG TPA: glutathione synthetase [Bacteriophage sp.]
MKILVACEESQAVCKAFRARGHEAYSADIQEPSGGHPEWHILGNVLPLINGNCTFYTMDGQLHSITGEWNMLIAFPPCTYMTCAGAVRMRVKGQIMQERYNKAMEAKAFFMQFYNAKCPRIAIENPTPMKIIKLPDYTQAIQPYQFGHPYSKRTCLWLKNLPHLQPTKILASHEPYVNGGCKDAHGNYRKFQGRKERDPKIRSKTFSGIAEAMAEQWGFLHD